MPRVKRLTNSRPPFVNDSVILELLALANVLKLNDEELPVLATLCKLSGSDFEVMRELADRFALRVVALTRGPRGAVLACDGPHELGYESGPAGICMKISLIGTGRVGSTVAFQLLLRGLGEELVLVDRKREIAEGEALDLQHAEAFTGHPVVVTAGGLNDTAGSDVIIISCSVPWSPAYTSRFDIGRDNLAVFREVVPPLAEASPEAKILVISNPVDVMTYHAIKLSGSGTNRVFGTGTLIDSGRFRAMLSTELGIHPDDLRAYILGEHGDTQLPVFSMAVAGGTRIAADETTHEIFRKASLSGYDVVRGKGHTNFAISMAATLIVEAIAWDTRRTMPLSVHMDGFLGIDDVCLSLPVVVGKEGITQVLHPDLGQGEVAALEQCARTVRQGIEQSLS